MYDICYLFLQFIIYAFLGWIVETVWVWFCTKKLVDRGFLIGPYCPIYGVGVLLIVNFLKDYMNNFLVLFILAMVICMVLEYITSYLMEKIFNARWWDYSERKFNINGRICLETAIPFGIGGIIIMYIVNPFIIDILNMLSIKFAVILGIILGFIFVIDLIISFSVIFKFRNADFTKFKDDTEEMSRRVREYLSEHSFLTKRLINSYPDVKIRIEEFKKIMGRRIEKYNKYRNKKSINSK